MRRAGQDLNVNRRLERCFSQCSLEDGYATLQVRERNVDELIETSGTDDGGVNDVRTIGRPNDEDVFARADAVDFREDLINDTISGLAASRTAYAS